MRKVQFYLGVGIAGAAYEEIVEFDDGTPDEEIQECFVDWRDNFLDASWWNVRDVEKCC